MDNIPVDSPSGYHQNPIQHHPQQQQQSGGGLHFDSNLKDIPQELAGQQQQQQPQATTDPSRQNNGASSSSTSSSTFGAATNNLNVFPSVLAPAPTPHHFSPAPGIPPNAAPQSMPPLQPAQVIGPDGSLQAPPPKRPRGRPRKVPGVDSRPRPQPNPDGTPRGRGRPKGSRGRGRPKGSKTVNRGGKRGRESSDEDDQVSLEESSEEEKEDKDVDLNEEVDDDFGPEGKVGATTKFGRKISKPKSFVPTTKATITRKKRQSVANFEANLMCEVCHLGHSPPGNALVICDACSKGWHQLCSVPIITNEIVASDLPFYCSECDKKLSEMKKEEDVNVGDEWTTGVGEDKGEESSAAGLPVPPSSEVDEGEGEDGEKKEGQEEKTEEEREKSREEEKMKPYSEGLKKEWLLGLPVNTLVGYILSIEKKYASSTDSPENGLPIWPKDLATLLQDAKNARIAEALERERKLEEEAEARAAAETPGGGGTETNSEAGTPMSFDGAGGEGGARTAASKRLQSEREAREAAQAAIQLTKDQQSQTQNQNQARPLAQQQQQPLAPYQRPSIPMASALGGGGGAGDIQVGLSGGGSNGLAPQQQQQHHLSHAHSAQSQSARYAAFNPSSYQPQQSSYVPQAQGFTSNPNPNMYANSGVTGGYPSPVGVGQMGQGGYNTNMYAQLGGGQQGYPGNGGGYNPNGLGRSQGGQGQ